MIDLRYPIGPFQMETDMDDAARQRLIAQIAETPARLREAVKGLSPAQLDTPYRPGGWTVRQVAHHLTDSHINAYTRFRLALTEETPTIKPYDQERWAELADARTAPVEASLAIMDGLYQRWIALLHSMSASDFARTFDHPESGILNLDRYLALSAWHGLHHVAHITSLRERMGWI
jgi:uncharacterized damage-inducible protein DinB